MKKEKENYNLKMLTKNLIKILLFSLFLVVNNFFSIQIESIKILTSKHRIPTIIIHIDTNGHNSLDNHNQDKEILSNNNVRNNLSHDDIRHSKSILVRLHYHYHHGNDQNNDDENYQLRLVNRSATDHNHRYRIIHVRRLNLSDSILHSSNNQSKSFEIIESKLATIVDDDPSIRMIRFRTMNKTNITNQIYTSPDRSTFLLVTIDKNNESMIRIYGLIDSQMMILPLQNQSIRNNFHRIINDEYHNEWLRSLFENYSNIHLKNHHHQFMQKNHIYPEITLLIDYHIHRMAHEYNDIDLTWRYGVMFVQMLQSLLFETIDDSNFQIHLHLKQILVAEQPWSFQLIRPKLTGSLLNRNKTDNLVNAMNALQKFGQWIYNHSDNVQSDLILILTGDDLCLDNNDDDNNQNNRTKHLYESCSYSSVKGQAIVGGACLHHHHNNLSLNLAIVEDYGLKMDGLHAMAHELGHLLGAVHDGEWPISTIAGPGGTNCRDKLSSIMNIDHSTIKQYNQWSKCTLEQFEHFFTQPQSICLFNEPHSNQ